MARDRKPASRLRRRWLLAALVFPLALVAGFAILVSLNARALIPLVERAAESTTGLPTSVGDLTITYRPSLQAVISEMNLGDEEFGATIGTVTAPLSLSDLWRGRLTAPSVSLEEVVLWLPQSTGAITEDFTSVVKAGRDTGGSGPGLDIGKLEAKNIAVNRQGQPWATVDITVEGVSLDNLSAQAMIRMADAQGVLAATVAYDKPQQRISGNLSYTGAIRALFTELGEQDLMVETNADLEGSFSEQVAAQLNGSFSSQTFAQSGTLSGLAFIKDGLFIVNDLQAKSGDSTVRLDTTLIPGREVAFEIYEAAIGAGSLKLLAATLETGGIKASVTENAMLDVTDLLGAIPLNDESDLRFERGTLALDGISVEPAEGATPFPPLRGIAASASVQGRQLRFEKLAASGIQLVGTVSIGEDNAYSADFTGHADLASLEIKGVRSLDAIDKLSGSVEIESIHLEKGSGLDAPTEIAFRGQAKDAGFTATLPGTEQPVNAKGIHGTVAYADGVLDLSQVRSEGLALSGTVALPEGSRPASFNLVGNIDLAHPIVALAVAESPVSSLRGKVVFSRLEGSIDPTSQALSGLGAEGSLTNGSLRLKLGEKSVQATGIEGNFKTADSQVTSSIILDSPELGPMRWSGTLNTTSLELKGALTANLARAIGAFVPVSESDVARKVMAAYGDSELALSAQLPKQDTSPRVDLIHEQHPPFRASAAFLANALGEYAISEASLDATIPLDGVSVPGALAIATTGQGNLSFKKIAGDDAYSATANLDAADIRLGEYLHKSPGQSMNIVLAGNAKEWSLQRLDVTLLNQKIPLTYKEGALAAEDFRLDLADLGPLFPPEVQSRGTISGRFQAQPMQAALRLADVSVALSPEVRADNVSGGLLYGDGAWQFEQLRVLAADSDFTIDAGLRDGSWSGNLSGRRMNVNALQAMQQAWSGNGSGTDSKSASTLQGELSIALDEVIFKQAQLTSVRGKLKFSPRHVELVDMAANAGGGTANASIIYTGSTDKGELALQISTSNVDASIIDGLLFPQPRGLKGATDANVDLRFPIAKDVPPYLGVDGTITFTSRNGTYGQAGFATRLLAVLRTTEVLRLRLPGFGDQGGLSFDESSAVIRATRGLVTLESFGLTAKSYAFDAAGTVDFPNDRTNIEGRMHILESVTGIVSAMPVLGTVVDRVKDRTGVAFVMTGSPFDVKVSAKPGTRPILDTRDGIRESVKEIRSLGDALGF